MVPLTRCRRERVQPAGRLARETGLEAGTAAIRAVSYRHATVHLRSAVTAFAAV